MDVTDWAAAKAIWAAIKESGHDIHDDLMVFVGVGPDGNVAVQVHSADEGGDEYAELQDRIEYLEDELYRLLKGEPETESHIDSRLKVFPSEP
jgi:hypothetical protein